MKCEICGQEIEGLYVEYDGKYFCRKDGDNCIKEYLYDNTKGCEYGTFLQGEKIRLSPSVTEGYLGMIKSENQKGGENGNSNSDSVSTGVYVHRNDVN